MENSAPDRYTFIICIVNSDSHFHNHDFLLTPKGWTLSPAYDMNPTLNQYQSLLVSSSSNATDLSLLREIFGEICLQRSYR
ncbi:HipA domain-containing protein [Porphyromonas macacae]|uniref:HipA domain-containing protein n=1 Tax=Porphyromonas macacae TaxID=28115 RepID=UPI0009DE56BD|nr:HipA domain-containing protein [Porphyromonas macacae]